MIRTEDENCTALLACEVVLRQGAEWIGFATREQYLVWLKEQEAVATEQRIAELFAGL
jgi:hypothetical protein